MDSRPLRLLNSLCSQNAPPLLAIPSPPTLNPDEPELSYDSGPTYLLQAFYSQLYEPASLRSRRANTKRLYRITLRVFADFLGRPPTLDDLTDDNLNRFAQARLAAKKTARTVNRNLSDLLAIWRWAQKKGYVDKMPDVQLEIEPKHTPVAWTQKELDTLFETASSLEGDVAELPANVWWTALLLCFWDSGERAGAVLGLTWDHVDTDTCWVRFPANNRKGGAADNARKIATDTRLALESLRRWQDTKECYSPTGKVFPWDQSPTYVWRAFSSLLKKAGLPHGKERKFHCIRKSVASHFEKAGGNATELLCHSSRAITKTYLDPRIVQRTEGIDLLFRPKGKKDAG